VASKDVRDAAADRRLVRRNFLLVALVAALAIAAATLVAFESRPLDHHYTFYASYGNTNGVPYTLLLPLPTDTLVREKWQFLGNGTAVEQNSLYGPVLKVSSWSNITVSARLDTWRDLPATVTTEGLDSGGRNGARLFLNSTEFSLGSAVKVSFTKVDPTWTLTRNVDGDLFEGWNTIVIRETLERTAAR
jgi:hypothetical protein